MKKILSILMVIALTISLTGLTAFATDSRLLPKAQRVFIYSSSNRVREGRTIQLDFKAYPANKDKLTFGYDRSEWSTLDYDLVEVDDFGEVTGLKAGDAEIFVRLYKNNPLTNRNEEVGSASIFIQVLHADGTSYTPEPSSTSSTNPNQTSVASGEKLSTATVTNSVNNAVVSGTTSTVTFKNATSISAAALQSASLAMQEGGGMVLLSFDTLAAGGKSVEGRLTINPRAAASVKGDIQLGVYTNAKAVEKVREKFAKFYKNDFMIIKAAQKGNYGMSVTYAVKVDSALSLATNKSLKLYSYDPEENQYLAVKNSNISIDDKGYAHFTTNLGDYLVIANGALARK